MGETEKWASAVAAAICPTGGSRAPLVSVNTTLYKETDET